MQKEQQNNKFIFTPAISTSYLFLCDTYNLFLRTQYTNPCNCAVYNWWYLKRTKGKSTKAILVDLALV